jgi:glutamyl-tRNA synthetase
VGNARTYLLAWLSVRSRGGRVVLRIEDLDSPRVKPWAAAQALADLRWLGLDWDEGPDVGGPHAPYVQTQRQSLYRAALEQLIAAERVYPCTCSRSDIAAAASAPHAGHEGPVYPGTCAHRRASQAPPLPGPPPGGGAREVAMPFAWRLRVRPTVRSFHDRLRGLESADMSRELGDFVVAKADGTPAYQLAVVVDDHAMGITEVLRGDDLVPSTFRQLELYEFFGWAPPTFVHVPLVVGPDGRRLAKRHGDTRLATLREQGVRPQRLVGLLAWSCGLLQRPEEVAPADLVPSFSLERVCRQPWVFQEEHQAWLAGSSAPSTPCPGVTPAGGECPARPPPGA